MDTMTVKWEGSGTGGSYLVIDHHRAHPDDALLREVERRAIQKLCDWDAIFAAQFRQQESQD